MREKGEANYVLGKRIYVDRSSRLLYMYKEKYLHKMLKRLNMKNHCFITHLSSENEVRVRICAQKCKKYQMSPTTTSEQPHVCYDKYKTWYFPCNRIYADINPILEKKIDRQQSKHWDICKAPSLWN